MIYVPFYLFLKRQKASWNGLSSRSLFLSPSAPSRFTLLEHKPEWTLLGSR